MSSTILLFSEIHYTVLELSAPRLVLFLPHFPRQDYREAREKSLPKQPQLSRRLSLLAARLIYFIGFRAASAIAMAAVADLPDRLSVL